MSDIAAKPPASGEAQPGLRSLLTPYEAPSLRKSIFQIATSIGLFLVAWTAMYWTLSVSYLLTALLALPTAGLLVRVFIVQHDCGHGSFFRAKRTNDMVGRFCSLLTFTPYAHWRRQHNSHHAHWNDLDLREPGADLYSTCATVAEYRALSAWGRFTYRAMRHPIMAHVFIPPLVFLFYYRLPFDTPKNWKRERRSIYLTNLAIAALLAVLMLVLGFWQVLLVQFSVIALTSIMGVGLFALQHRFDDVFWARHGEWEVTKAALQGSSYLKLPRLLQWFSGNIGFHHIHHLSPKVPNYRLEHCHKAIPALRTVKTLSWFDGLKALRLMLWDEANGRMIRFKDLHA